MGIAPDGDRPNPTIDDRHLMATMFNYFYELSTIDGEKIVEKQAIVIPSATTVSDDLVISCPRVHRPP